MLLNKKSYHVLITFVCTVLLFWQFWCRNIQKWHFSFTFSCTRNFKNKALWYLTAESSRAVLFLWLKSVACSQNEICWNFLVQNIQISPFLVTVRALEVPFIHICVVDLALVLQRWTLLGLWQHFLVKYVTNNCWFYMKNSHLFLNYHTSIQAKWVAHGNS